ncbi:MAG TPA: TlyA family RNA methyltransferase [Bacillota bacterium]|nr:TlyA family RNA methyltransferase [Bacillota bacterium]
MKQRCDSWLVEKGYFQSREQAQRAIMAGEVTVNGKRIEKASQLLEDTEGYAINLAGSGEKYVSRGAHKLKKAVESFGIRVTGRICLDAGAPTGGFTDYLLQNGAELVYAVDVGYGQLAWKLRQDPRVKVFERQNIRYFEAEQLERLPSLITADLSFISLQLVLAKFRELIAVSGELVTLIKPQFEAGRDKVGKKGVVRDRAVHLEVIQRLVEKAPESGWNLINLTYSPILGPEGNIEYLGHWSTEPQSEMINMEGVVTAAWAELKLNI